MKVVVLGLVDNFSLGNFQFSFWLGSFGAQVFGRKWRVEIDIGNLGWRVWSVVALKLIFLTLVVTFNIVDLLFFFL